MKAIRLFQIVPIATAVLLGGSRPALAQRVTAGDATGAVAWLSTHKGSPDPYGGRTWHNSLFGAVGAGWYWTDNLKTEVDFGGSTRTRAFRTERVTIDGRPLYATIETTFSRRTVGISQQYQFFHNDWFHPHVAIGANVTTEHLRDRHQPIYVYDDVTRTSRFVPQARSDGTRTETAVRPFVAVGFKGYMSSRTFIRGDLRIAFRRGVDEALVRLGFGVDF